MRCAHGRQGGVQGLDDSLMGWGRRVKVCVRDCARAPLRTSHCREWEYAQEGLFRCSNLVFSDLLNTRHNLSNSLFHLNILKAAPFCHRTTSLFTVFVGWLARLGRTLSWRSDIYRPALPRKGTRREGRENYQMAKSSPENSKATSKTRGVHGLYWGLRH